MRATPSQLTFTSGTNIEVVSTGPAYLFGFLLGMDGANDPTITFYNCGTSTTAGKTEVVPSNSYDASALNLNGFTSPMKVYCSEGIAVENVIGAGGTEITVLWARLPVWCTG